MDLVKILNADHRPVDVEVSLEIYRVYEESRKQEERQRYERRKHIEGKSFDDCLLYDLATEPLEETAERLETLLEIGCILEKLPPLQRWRFILHFLYGYSYSEIAKMQDCNKSAVMRSVHSALKKIRKKSCGVTINDCPFSLLYSERDFRTPLLTVYLEKQRAIRSYSVFKFFECCAEHRIAQTR